MATNTTVPNIMEVIGIVKYGVSYAKKLNKILKMLLAHQANNEIPDGISNFHIEENTIAYCYQKYIFRINSLKITLYSNEIVVEEELSFMAKIHGKFTHHKITKDMRKIHHLFRLIQNPIEPSAHVEIAEYSLSDTLFD